MDKAIIDDIKAGILITLEDDGPQASLTEITEMMDASGYPTTYEQVLFAAKELVAESKVELVDFASGTAVRLTK